MIFQGIKSRITEIIVSAASETGYTIYESFIFLKGENTRLTIKIDHPDGISHRDCEIYSKELSRKLDGERILPNYSLEVSSPGVNRSLRNPSEFIRFKGSKVKVVYDGDTGRVAVKGIMSEVNESDGITVISEGNEVQIGFDNISSANLEL